MEIIIATKNVHKVRELRELFKLLTKHEALTLHHFSDYKIPLKEESSFQECAVFKATHAARTLNKWVLADDSGLVVPSLNGISKRYTGSDQKDRDNRFKLLQELSAKSSLERAAYYECG